MARRWPVWEGSRFKDTFEYLPSNEATCDPSPFCHHREDQTKAEQQGSPGHVLLMKFSQVCYVRGIESASQRELWLASSFSRSPQWSPKWVAGTC